MVTLDDRVHSGFGLETVVFLASASGAKGREKSLGSACRQVADCEVLHQRPTSIVFWAEEIFVAVESTGAPVIFCWRIDPLCLCWVAASLSVDEKQVSGSGAVLASPLHWSLGYRNQSPLVLSDRLVAPLFFRQTRSLREAGPCSEVGMARHLRHHQVCNSRLNRSIRRLDVRLGRGPGVVEIVV